MLSARSACALGLVGEAESGHRVLIAVSHDCDIASENLIAEPAVEFIVGDLIDKVDGSFTRAKNARVLHLEFNTPDGKRAVALFIRRRVEVAKIELAAHEPEAGWTHASPKAITSLRWWLAARYFRSSFADTFESRLSQSNLSQKIDALLSPLGELVYGIFFLVDDGSGDNLEDAELHELRAVIVYDAENADNSQIDSIKDCADNVAAAFKSKLRDKMSGHWTKIELITCIAVSDEVFSFADSRLYKLWRLEFRSLEDNSQKLPVQGA